ncbi:MAG: hypothetical protein E6Q40_01375 [Cupriavidus sp.]|nr:MAG: hypothetical protein E6Q40_01375 [Cupriavidus sp.]
MGQDLALAAALCVAAIAVAVAINAMRPSPIAWSVPAGKAVKSLSLEETLGASHDGQVVFLDARDPYFYAEGHLPRARNVPRSQLGQAAKYVSALPRHSPVIVYCSDEGCADSGIVGRYLVTLGFQDVSVYKGGWEEWSAAELPVEK